MTLKKLQTDGRIKPHKTGKAGLDDLRVTMAVQLTIIDRLGYSETDFIRAVFCSFPAFVLAPPW